MSAAEENVRATIVSDMLGEFIVERDGEVLVATGTNDKKFMVEIRVLEVTE